MRTGRRGTQLVVFGAILLAVVAVAFLMLTLGPEQGSHTYLHVSQANENAIDGSMIEYDDMTADQRAIFDGALSDGEETIPTAVDESVWIDNHGVRYQNRTYHVVVSVP